MSQAHSCVNEELHEDLVRILTDLIPVVGWADLQTLCYGCGIAISEIYADITPDTMTKEIPFATNANPF